LISQPVHRALVLAALFCYLWAKEQPLLVEL